MIRTILLLALLGVFTFLLIFSTGCASSGMYFKQNDCILDSNGAMFTCDYVQDGEVKTYKKSFNSRNKSNEPHKENVK